MAGAGRAAAERAVLHPASPGGPGRVPGHRARGEQLAADSAAHRVFLGWNYWWQAHLLDCLVDAQLRNPQTGPATA